MNQRLKKTVLHRPSREGLTCLLCSFGVSLAATSFNALVRPRELHRRVSGHLQRRSATWKHMETMGKHLQSYQRNRWSLDWEKKKKQKKRKPKTHPPKTHGVWAVCFVSFSHLIPALVLLSSTTLTLVLNQALAESTHCANLIYICHFQEELSN